jgi:hypothetical protein
MKNSITFFVYFLCIFFSFSQTEKVIQGKIICDNNPVQGIQITNLVSEKSTVSNFDGTFSIVAKEDDLMVFTSVNYDYKRKLLDQQDIDKDNLIINLSKKTVQLEEVVVTKNNQFDAVKMGILEKSAKEYTPAERKLKEAGDFKAWHLLGVLGGGIALNPILNAISGRTKQLKQEIIIERQEFVLAKISTLYEDNYYTEKLKINQAYIKAFQYYAVYDDKLIENLISKNKTAIHFRMIELAQEFNKLLENEK